MNHTLRFTVCFLISMLPTSIAVGADETVDIGTHRELFVDRLLIDKLDGTSLKLHQPQAAGVAVKYDRSWEGPFSFYSTVLHDSGDTDGAGDVYRLYYRGRAPGRPSVTCYAESRDGITWTKPDLGIVEIDGSKSNNVILPHSGTFCPFIDVRPGVPASERYKANSLGTEGPRHLVTYVSADGVHWTQVEGVSISAPFYNSFDSQNVMFWSEVEECYVLYARHMKEGRRATARATSKDFRQWSEQTPMLYSDTGTTLPAAHLYTNQTHPYFRAPHLYVSLPARIFFGELKHIRRDDDKAAAHRRILRPEELAFYKEHRVPGGGGPTDASDAVFLTSRAGTLLYDFTFQESFIRPGIGLSHWQSRTNYPALGVVRTGPHEMSLYVQRNYAQKTAYLERFALRIDGFASVHAPYAGGEALTKPFTFEGRELEINYSTSAAGSIRIEIQQADGTPIPGHTLAECPPLIGDEIERVIEWGELPKPEVVRDEARGQDRLVVEPWTGERDISRLAGKPIRLRFVMRDADLFSLRFR